MRRLVLAAKPAARVEVEEADRALGSLLELGRQRGEHLQPGVGEHPAEPELGDRPGEQRLRFLCREAGQARPVAAGEPIPARRTADGLDRNAGRGERVGIALDRPLGHLEPLGELRRRQLPPGLEQEEERDQSARTHPPIIGDKR